MPSAATKLTDAGRMRHALELGFETLRDLGAAVSIFGSARAPVCDPDTLPHQAAARRRSPTGRRDRR